MKINMKQWQADVLAAKDIKAVPIMTHPGIDLTGDTVKNACCDGEIHANAVCALAKKYPTHAATVIMDLTTEAEAFGAEVHFTENEVPAIIGHMLNNSEDIHNLQVPSLKEGRVPQYLKANLLAAENITDRPVFGGCIGPFSLAGRLYDMSEIMVLIYQDPDAAHELLQKCTDFILKYCLAMKATGVNGVVMAEPAAGLMSNDDCKTFSSVYVKKIIDAVQDDYFAVVLHNCGNTNHCTEAMVSTGATALHVGNKCSMEVVLQDTPADILCMGNLDPVSVFKDSTPEEMYRSTEKLLETCAKFPNFVLSSGCDTPPHTPLENIDKFFEALNNFNSKK